MTIRPIIQSDLPAFKALRLEALREHPEAFGSDYHEAQLQPESAWIERITAAVEGKTHRIFLADAGAKELAGMLGVYRSHGVKNEHAASIWGVYIRPQFRGQRLCEQLMRSALDW